MNSQSVGIPVLQGREDVNEVLINDGLDPNAFFNYDDQGPNPKPIHVLMAAVNQGTASSVEALLEAGSKPKLAAYETGVTPLMSCLNKRVKTPLPELLVAAGDDVGIRLPSGWGLVHTAAAGENVAALNFLERHGAPLDLVTLEQVTPLHKCTESADALRWLLQRIPHLINVQDQNGATPLMMAADGKSADSVRVLIEFGADLDLRDRALLRADDIARKAGFFEGVEQIEVMRQARQAVTTIDSIRRSAQHTSSPAGGIGG